jgi:dihydroorotate dehydrogenase
MTTQEMLDARYGRRSARSRRTAWIVAGAVAAAIVGAFAWSTVTSSMNAVNAEDTAFRLVDAHSVEVSFQFTSPIGARVACAVEAQDEQHGTVGWKVVEFAPADVHAQSHTTSIPTVAEATTGFVNSCWVP